MFVLSSAGAVAAELSPALGRTARSGDPVPAQFWAYGAGGLPGSWAVGPPLWSRPVSGVGWARRWHGAKPSDPAEGVPDPPAAYPEIP